VNTVMNLRIPYNVRKFLSGSATGSFSRSAQIHGVSYNTESQGMSTSKQLGRAAPQLRRLVVGFPPRQPGFEPGVWSCGICDGQSGAGAGSLRVLWFPLPTFISHQLLHNLSSVIWGWYNTRRPVVAAVPSGLSLTPLRIVK
jgi:hypothetical protein